MLLVATKCDLEEHRMVDSQAGQVCTLVCVRVRVVCACPWVRMCVLCVCAHVCSCGWRVFVCVLSEFVRVCVLSASVRVYGSCVVRVCVFRCVRVCACV